MLKPEMRTYFGSVRRVLKGIYLKKSSKRSFYKTNKSVDRGLRWRLI